jgi:hypothetical protein
MIQLRSQAEWEFIHWWQSRPRARTPPRVDIGGLACALAPVSENPGVSDFWSLPQKALPPPAASGLLSEIRALRR